MPPAGVPEPATLPPLGASTPRPKTGVVRRLWMGDSFCFLLSVVQARSRVYSLQPETGQPQLRKISKPARPERNAQLAALIRRTVARSREASRRRTQQARAQPAASQRPASDRGQRRPPPPAPRLPTPPDPLTPHPRYAPALTPYPLGGFPPACLFDHPLRTLAHPVLLLGG